MKSTKLMFCRPLVAEYRNTRLSETADIQLHSQSPKIIKNNLVKVFIRFHSLPVLCQIITKPF